MQRVFAVNSIGPILCAQQAVKRMAYRHNGSGGVVINISSASARLGSPNEYVDYAASKGALETFTIGFAKEVAREGIRVNCIRPGHIYTEMHASGGEPGRVDRVKDSIPMGRGGQPEEVARAILWLAGPEASFITGTFLDVTSKRRRRQIPAAGSLELEPRNGKLAAPALARSYAGTFWYIWSCIDMNVSFRPHWLLTFALPLVLIACGSKEPEQRAAFTQFLQARIIDKPGVHVPKLTADESQAFGEYTSQYALITDFNTGMDAVLKPLDGLVHKAAIHSISDVLTHRDDLKSAQDGLNDLDTLVKQQQVKADSAHAQLKQPQDLKAVYDKAYERTVSLPATALLEVLPQISEALNSTLKVADFVDAHKAQIDINGPLVSVKDPQVLAQMNVLLQDLNAQGKNIQQAQAHLQAVMLGR
jgi:hypothetical protein